MIYRFIFDKNKIYNILATNYHLSKKGVIGRVEFFFVMLYDQLLLYVSYLLLLIVVSLFLMLQLRWIFLDLLK